MPSFRERLLHRILDLAWSVWAEMGVSGWKRSHAAHAVDPEPLILFTAALGDADPRLRDESLDWCIKYGRWVAGARLRNLVEQEPEAIRAAFGEYAATVGAHSTTRWPLATGPRAYEPTGRSHMEDFARASLIAFRLRALFGVGARAEVLRVLIARRGEALTASEFADDVCYTKRNVADALAGLKMAGILTAEPVRNHVRFRLAKPKELSALIGKRPEAFLPWRQLFRILQVTLDLAGRAEKLEPRVREVEMHRALRALAPDLRCAGLTFDRVEATAGPSWPSFEHWALTVAVELASGDVNALRSAQERSARISGSP